MSRPSLPPVRRPTIVLVVTIFALAFPLGVWANHQFSDVPTGASYHDEVDQLVGAGITAGCGGTNYCPANPVTRGSMSQFLVRGLSHVVQSNEELTTTITDDDIIEDVAAVTITVPSVSGTQFVLVQGSVVVFGDGTVADCPCNASFAVAETTEAIGPNRQFDQLPGTAHTQRTFSTSHLFAAAPGEHTYYLNLGVTAATALTVANVNLTATTIPFGSDGTDTSSLEPAAEDADGGRSLNQP